MDGDTKYCHCVRRLKRTLIQAMQQQIKLVASIIWCLWRRINEKVQDDMEKHEEHFLHHEISSLHE